MRINRQDTNGVKPLLQVGELGYDNYTTGGDAGRVYVGNGAENIPQAKKAEVVAVDGKVDTHTVRVDNPHSVTKAQVGLSNVDNTADSAKVVASAGKWTTSRLINGTAVDGTVNITTSQWGTSRNITIGNTTKSVNGSTNISWSLNEIGAIGAASPAFTGVPTAPTAVVNTNTTQLATTAFVNAEIANDATPRVTGIDTAIPKFDGVSGAIQSSHILINSSDNLILPKASGGSLTVSLVDGASNTNLVLPESGTVATESQVGVANSELVKTALNATGTAPIYACRAWVNFNGTGTVAIRASGNVSSITDNGVGNYTINFTTSMPDANYDFITGHSSGLGLEYRRNTGILSYDSTSIRIQCGYDDAAVSQYEDFNTVTASIFR